MMALNYLKDNVENINSYLIRHKNFKDIHSDRQKHLLSMDIDFKRAHSFSNYYAKSADFATTKFNYALFRNGLFD